MNIFTYYIMPQIINMKLTTSKPTNRSSSIKTVSQPRVPINTNMNRVNVSRFNMNSIFGARGRPCG